MYLRTEAIVIGKTNLREADRIVTFYTRFYGKIDAVVRGIRKIENRFGSSLELFTHNELVLWEKKRGDLLTLTQCQTKESFFKIRSDLKKIASAFYLVDMVDELTKEGDKNTDLFNLLIISLHMLENADQIQTIVCSFQLKLLYSLGLGPELNKCVVCKNKIIDKKQYLSFPRGGIICKACVKSSALNIMLPYDTLEMMKKLIQTKINHIPNIVLSAKIIREIQHLFSKFVYYHLEKKIKSKGIFEKLSMAD